MFYCLQIHEMWLAIVSKLHMLTSAQVCVHMHYDQKYHKCVISNWGFQVDCHNSCTILKMSAKHPLTVYIVLIYQHLLNFLRCSIGIGSLVKCEVLGKQIFKVCSLSHSQTTQMSRCVSYEIIVNHHFRPMLM